MRILSIRPGQIISQSRPTVINRFNPWSTFPSYTSILEVFLAHRCQFPILSLGPMLSTYSVLAVDLLI